MFEYVALMHSIQPKRSMRERMAVGAKDADVTRAVGPAAGDGNAMMCVEHVIEAEAFVRRPPAGLALNAAMTATDLCLGITNRRVLPLLFFHGAERTTPENADFARRLFSGVVSGISAKVDAIRCAILLRE